MNFRGDNTRSVLDEQALQPNGQNIIYTLFSVCAIPTVEALVGVGRLGYSVRSAIHRVHIERYPRAAHLAVTVEGQACTSKCTQRANSDTTARGTCLRSH